MSKWGKYYFRIILAIFFIIGERQSAFMTKKKNEGHKKDVNIFFIFWKEYKKSSSNRHVFAKKYHKVIGQTKCWMAILFFFFF